MQLARLVPLAFVLFAACGSDSTSATTTPPPAAPTPGWLTLQLTTPNSNDGAVQFAITGPAIDSVKLISYDGFAVSDNGAVNLVVAGDVTSGDIARIHVADVGLTGQYRVSVSAAAVRQTYELQTTDSYRAVFVR